MTHAKAQRLVYWIAPLAVAFEALTTAVDQWRQDNPAGIVFAVAQSLAALAWLAITLVEFVGWAKSHRGSGRG